MVDNFNDDTWSAAYVKTDLLPSFRELTAATKAAFGSKIAGIKPTEPRFNIFDSINFVRTNYIYFTGHELYHDLEKQRTAYTLVSFSKEAFKSIDRMEH